MSSYHSHDSTSRSSNKLILRTQVYSHTTSPPNEIVTFSFEDVPVFIKRPETYQEAIDIAKKEYTMELAHLPNSRICFALKDVVHGGRHVRVSESAWPSISQKIPNGTIINILVLPDPDAKLPPPEYHELPQDYNGSNSSKSTSPLSFRHSKSSTRLLSWIGTGK